MLRIERQASRHLSPHKEENPGQVSGSIIPFLRVLLFSRDQTSLDCDTAGTPGPRECSFFFLFFFFFSYSHSDQISATVCACRFNQPSIEATQRRTAIAMLPILPCDVSKSMAMHPTYRDRSWRNGAAHTNLPYRCTAFPVPGNRGWIVFRRDPRLTWPAFC